MRSLLTSVIAIALLVAPASAQHWPSFRGPSASGIATLGHPPASWDVTSGRNVVWKASIPGLGHSSPVVWGDRVFVTTAVAPGAAAGSVALGDVDRAGTDPAKDLVPHQWQLHAIDAMSGRLVWSRTVHQGVPRAKRHVKSSHASATPATDGRYLVALFGSEGLYAFDMAGKQLWRQDLGLLSVGLADDPTYEWGPASSPIVHGDLVIVQNDRYKDSALVAFDLVTGRERWRSPREELPAWSTPTIHVTTARATVVTNSPRFIRGHDAATGRELWRLQDPQGEVKVSTPVLAGDLIIVTGGYPATGRPIYALRVADGSVAWRLERGSPYTTTPIVYDDLLYVITDNGILSAYRAASGERVYQQRVARDAGSFSASPVAADGKLYFTSEDGQVYVVAAGPTFRLLATNEMAEVCMATPAISGDLLIVRTRTALVALAERSAASDSLRNLSR